jgi:hypothetical protein
MQGGKSLPGRPIQAKEETVKIDLIFRRVARVFEVESSSTYTMIRYAYVLGT